MRKLSKPILPGFKRCRQCNAMVLIQVYDANDKIARLMNKEGLCYDCAYWENVYRNPPKDIEFLGNRCLKILPMVKKRDKTMLLGGKGKLRYFVRNDLSVIRSNDIWTIGTVPENYREKLPSTIREITNAAYKKLSKHSRKCMARGCFDRYNCIRYRIELENDHIGAFNEVSPFWKVGGENCKDFVNTKEIISDDSSVGK